MRFTLRRNGRFHATVITKHYPGLADLARFLCRNEGRGFGFNGPSFDGTDPGTELTRTQLHRALRDAIARRGRYVYAASEMDTWEDDLTDDETLQVARWAIDMVRRLHPELDDETLREYEAEWDWDHTDDDNDNDE